MLEFKATTHCIVWWRKRPSCVKCPSICLAPHLLFGFFSFVRSSLICLCFLVHWFVIFFLFLLHIIALLFISHHTIVLCCCLALMLSLWPCWCSSPYLVVVIACSYSLSPLCYSLSPFYYFSSPCCYYCCLTTHSSTSIAFACHLVDVCSIKPSSLFGEEFFTYIF